MDSKTYGEEYLMYTHPDSATLIAALAEIERLRAECERHIQEVDASREAIERKDAALRMALDALKGAPDVDRVMETAITTISEALA